MTKSIIEKQNKDMRTRLDNQRVKFELKEAEYQSRIEELEGRLGDAPKQISMLQEYISKLEKEIVGLRKMIRNLKRVIEKLKRKVEKLGQTIRKLRARLKKDSSTSDKPPSSDTFAKPKPKSQREKSGRKPGGQKGHTGHGVAPFESPTQTIKKMPGACGSCGGEVAVSQQYARRQVVDIEFSLRIVEEQVYSGVCRDCGAPARGEFSGEFLGPVQYGKNLKSLVALLNEYGCVSDSKTAEIVSSLSGKAFPLSSGTVFNIRKGLSAALEKTIDIIREGLIAGAILCGDETGLRVNGSLNWLQVFCNSHFALYAANSKRGDIDAGIGILTFFVGVLVHDHLSSYYKYDTITHAECNEHILRYLKALLELFGHEWLTEMSELLKSACHEKNELLRANKKCMPEETIKGFTDKYSAILEKGWGEYNAATAGDELKEKYHTEERRLLTRLGEYKDQHLLFLSNFDVPFTNNLAEQGIRVAKSKYKVSGGFRTDEGAEIYARIMSLITTLRKQGKNIFEGILSVFNGEVPINSSA